MLVLALSFGAQTANLRRQRISSCSQMLRLKGQLIKRSQKKVLISARLQDVSGVEIHVMNLCQWLVRVGAQVTFASRFIRRQARPIVEELRRSPVQLVSTPFAHQGDRRSTSTGRQEGTTLETPINNLPESYRAAARAASPTAAPAVEPAGIVPGLPRQWRGRYRGPRGISWRRLEAAAENGYLT